MGYRHQVFYTKTAAGHEEVVQEGFTRFIIISMKRGHGGDTDSPKYPFKLKTKSGPLIEFPISVANFFTKDMCFFGGGYLRLFPYNIIQRMQKKVNLESRPVVFYLHPRDIDEKQPRLAMGLFGVLNLMSILSTTLIKAKKLLTQVITLELLGSSHFFGG